MKKRRGYRSTSIHITHPKAVDTMLKTLLAMIVLFVAVSIGYGQTAIERGNMKFILKDYTGAIADYNNAIKLDPKDAKAFQKRGDAKRTLEDYRGSIVDYNKAIELDPKESWAYFSRGVAKYMLEDSRGAIADFNKAIELDPTFASAYYNRGLAKLLMGQKDSGCRDLSKAGELGYDGAYDAIKEYCR